MATDLVDEAIDFADELNVAVHTLPNDATVLDFGVEVPGGIETGLMAAEIQTAGLATVGTAMEDVAGAGLTHVELSTDHPAMALLASQKAGWELGVDDFEGLGSGPARALVAEEDEYDRLGYRDDFDFAVLAVESDELPDERVVEHVADRAGVLAESVFLLGYRSASLTGSVVAATRAAELATFRLMELGYDPRGILSATGSAPVPPVASDEATAMARATDTVAYGGRVHLVVERDDACFDDVPSTASDANGRPFADVFADHDWALDEIDADAFGPAQVTVDVLGGPTYAVGDTDETVLADSFEL